MQRFPWLFAALCLVAQAALAQSTVFTYQGELKSNGTPATGLHDFRFRLFDAASGGAAIGSQLCIDNVQVAEGKFTASIDFGQAFATTAGRFLEVEVRRDTGLNCASAAGFVILVPRQPITSAPRAAAANTAFSLSAPDGAPANAVVVDNAGSVGINTATPLNRLHVTAASVADGIRLTGGVGADPGFLFFNGAIQRGAIGLAASPTNWSQDAAANDLVFRTESGSKLLLQSGTFASALAINSVNNVGIGTAAPTAKLDVRGDIRLGASGQLRATSSEENLRIVRGVVNGNGSIIVGSGFTVSHGTEGQYTITFATPFTGPPAFTATANDFGLGDTQVVSTVGVTSTTVGVFTKTAGITGGTTDMTFHFIAIGPR